MHSPRRLRNLRACVIPSEAMNLSSPCFRLCLLVAALLLVASPGFAAFDETFEQTVPLAASGSFTLANVNGSVRVEGWNRDAVEIRATKFTEKDQRDLKRVRIEVTAAPDAVSVRTKYPEDEGVEVYVDYRIRVPHRALLRAIETVNGSIRVARMESRGELRAVNGNVEVLDSGGAYSARTTNGDVRMELQYLDAQGAMNVETVNGTVTLAVPPNADADLDLSSMNGELRSELPVMLRGSGTRDFRGRVGRGGCSVRVRTVNGAIELAAAKTSV